ncbi:MAG: insulinase family protein [Ignavibacteria bacterium]|nr:insulinase family protein [Ignavibacteria bacterium]
MIIDRATPPQSKEQAVFHLPQIQQITLPSGLSGLFIEKAKLPMVQFMFVVSTGSAMDAVGKSGLANLTAILIDEGAGGLSALELNNQFEMLGSSIQISINHEFMYFTILSLEEKFSETLSLLGKIISQPHFEQNEFLREKSKVQAQLLNLKNEPDSIADRIFEEEVFGASSKLGHLNLGKEKDVESLSNDDVKNFYHSFIETGMAGFVCAGSLKVDELKNLIQKHLDNRQVGNNSDSPKLPIPEKKRRLYFVHKNNAQQTEIRIGNLSGRRRDTDFYAKTVMNTILGGQFNSRINFKLREKKGFTYGATSYFAFRKECGYFLLTTSVQSEHTFEALKDIFYELKQIKNVISTEELEAAKLSIIRKFPSNFETYYQLVSGLNTLYTYDLPASYFNDYPSNIKAITIEDALTAAGDNINEEEMVAVLVGDKTAFRNLVGEFGFDEIIEMNEEGERLISL